MTGSDTLNICSRVTQQWAGFTHAWWSLCTASFHPPLVIYEPMMSQGLYQGAAFHGQTAAESLHSRRHVLSPSSLKAVYN